MGIQNNIVFSPQAKIARFANGLKAAMFASFLLLHKYKANITDYIN
jgi:hypothetical protein